MFFDKMGGGAGMGPGMGGMGGGAAGLTSPGMNPQSLAALMAMFSGGDGGVMGGPQMPMPPGRPMGGGSMVPPIPAPPQPQAAPPMGAMPAMPSAGGQQPNLMAMLAKMDPAQLQALLAKLGIGGGAGMMPGQGMGGMPGGGTGGLY